MNEADPGHVRVDSFLAAADVASVAHDNYKGLAIHALPQIHEYFGRLAARRLPAGSRVLDLASGSGAFRQRLLDLGFYPTGCDIVPQNLRLHGAVPFSVTNLNLSLPPELIDGFDCVTALEIVEHVENPRLLLRQCYRALRPGGMLLLSTPNVDSVYSKAVFIRTGDFQRFGEAEYNGDGHITPITQTTLGRALAEAGFVDVSIESIVPTPSISWR